MSVFASPPFVYENLASKLKWHLVLALKFFPKANTKDEMCFWWATKGNTLQRGSAIDHAAIALATDSASNSCFVQLLSGE